MYRNCCKSKCNCNNTVVASEFEDCLEETCSDVENTLGMYDECKCGFDEFSSLPENPVLGQSYVPFQTMNRTFIPCVRIKNGYYLSRTCKSIYAWSIYG